METINQPFRFEERFNEVLTRMCMRHPGGVVDIGGNRRWPNLSLDKALEWPELPRPWHLGKASAAALALYVAFMAVVQTAPDFSIGWAVVLTAGYLVVTYRVIKQKVFPTPKEDTAYRWLPQIHRHFFRLNRARVVDLQDKCNAFSAMVESLPPILDVVSGKEALVTMQVQRRDKIEAEIKAYLRDIELIDGIYWLDRNQKLDIDVGAYGFTGDMTALVSMVQAREELSENFPAETHYQLTSQ